MGHTFERLVDAGTVRDRAVKNLEPRLRGQRAVVAQRAHVEGILCEGKQREIARTVSINHQARRYHAVNRLVYTFISGTVTYVGTIV